MNNLTHLTPEQLNVGDVVGILSAISVGWSSRYRHPLVKKAVVERISPKRQKFVIDGVSFTDKEIYSNIVSYDDVAVKEDELARKYQQCADKKYKLQNAKNKYGNEIITLAKLDDEDLDKVLNLLTYLETKYLTQECKMKNQ